jgi:hypothetical protein
MGSLREEARKKKEVARRQEALTAQREEGRRAMKKKEEEEARAKGLWACCYYALAVVGRVGVTPRPRLLLVA